MVGPAPKVCALPKEQVAGRIDSGQLPGSRLPSPVVPAPQWRQFSRPGAISRTKAAASHRRCSSWAAGAAGRFSPNSPNSS